MITTFDVAVVGGGMAGLTAAHHVALEGAAVLHIAGDGIPGGLVANVGELEGFPGPGPTAAIDVAMRMLEENKRLGVEVVTEDASRLEVAGAEKRLGVGSQTFTARTVVAATGARLRMLEVTGVARLLNKGVSQCAWCNGSLHRGQDVVVVGGGDSALQEALHLAKFASLVTVVTRGENLRARATLIDRAANNARIAFRWESEVVEVLGDDRVATARIRDRASGLVEELPCTGVFVYIGLVANSAWLGDSVARDAQGFVMTNADLETQTPGVFAAGALRSGYRGRLTNAVGEATAAALSATRHCNG